MAWREINFNDAKNRAAFASSRGYAAFARGGDGATKVLNFAGAPRGAAAFKVFADISPDVEALQALQQKIRRARGLLLALRNHRR